MRVFWGPDEWGSPSPPASRTQYYMSRFRRRWGTCSQQLTKATALARSWVLLSYWIAGLLQGLVCRETEKVSG
ncbi:hypothetical protein NDU88_005315 [Pleurodeles waltl]|uniref:Uncharacterized protein n=1 Tax=Pleurodeles waltl TaxID=8319 RepID=A0AAV7NQ96_PLEWA|nr:hypothetical protein NDU88_005315 [Pleurodeles waltl]